MWTAIALIVSAVLATVIGGVAAGVNKQSVEDTNKTNLQIAQETNQSNVEQAELAYRRSLPTAQIRQLMDAGMSRPAALASLTGGGTYSAPVLQSAKMDAPQMDLSGVASGIERLGNVPTNVEQSQLIEQQRSALATEVRLKEEAAAREQEQHNFDMWQKMYGKDATMKIDALSSEIVQEAADKGISLDGIDSVDKLVKSFNLGSNKIWREMPNMARTQVLEGVRTQAAENRANQTQANQNRAALDAHELAQFDKQLKQLDISEKEQSLVYKLALLANSVSLSNNEVVQSDYNRILRDAGFANEKEAYEAIKVAENLEAGHRKERSTFRSTRPKLAEDIGDTISWLIDKVNPLKGLISTGK